jgi:O-antigen/teichoic acid export membrane protein
VQLVSTAALLWLVRIATLLCSALLSVLTARFLGPAGRGIFTFPGIDASLATTLAAGLSSAATYFLLNRNSDRSIVRVASIALLMFIACGFALTYATAAASHSLWALPAAFIFLISYSAYSLAYGILVGFERPRSAGLLSAVAYILPLTLVTAALLTSRSSPRLAIAGWVSGMAIAGGFALVVVFKMANRRVGTLVNTRDFLLFGTRAALLNVANLLNYRIDIYIVAILAPVNVVGLYTLAVTGAESALSLTLALSQATLPRMGKMQPAEAAIFTARCLRNNVFIASILALCGYLTAPLVIRLLFGPNYASIVMPLRVLLIGLVAASTSALISNYFMLNRGRMQVPLLTSLISTVLCATICAGLVPKVGMLGAAVGSTVAYICSQAIAVGYFCRESNVPWLNAVLINRGDIESYGRLARRLTTAVSK